MATGGLTQTVATAAPGAFALSPADAALGRAFAVSDCAVQRACLSGGALICFWQCSVQNPRPALVGREWLVAGLAVLSRASSRPLVAAAGLTLLR